MNGSPTVELELWSVQQELAALPALLGEDDALDGREVPLEVDVDAGGDGPRPAAYATDDDTA